MTRKARLTIAAFLVAGGATVFTTTLVHSLYYAPENQTSQTPSAYSAEGVSSSSYPARLIIPALGINAKVQLLGVNAEGNMAAPSNFTDVGWYRYGTVPGNAGSAVIDGHLDNGLGLSGVFKHLDSLHTGDDVYVIARNGNRLHFTVSEVTSYPYTAAPNSLIFNQDNGARLNLITCEGAWVPGKETYNRRLVIFTTLSKS